MVGLSRNARVKPLLSRVQGQNRAEKPLKEPLDIDAPPASSDEEQSPDDELARVSCEEDSSPKGNVRSANIVKTTFGKTNSSLPSQRRSMRANAQRKGNEQSEAPAKPAVADVSASSAAAKRSVEDTSRNRGDLLDQFGQVKRSKTSRTAGSKRATYGRGSQASSQRSMPNSSNPQAKDESPGGQGFVMPGMESPTPSPEKSRAAFRAASVLSQSASPVAMRFRPIPLDPHAESSDELNSTKKKTSAKVPGKGKGSGDTNVKGANPSRRKRAVRQPGKRSTPNPPESPIQTETQINPFQMPTGLDDLEDMLNSRMAAHDESKNLDTASESDLSDLGIGNESSEAISVCPMCGKPVDPELLKKHSKNGRMGIKQQAAFCRLHSRRSARDLARSRGYPEVDWDLLSQRLVKHQVLLRDVLEGKRPSHYASEYKAKINAGKNRTLLKTEESATPGYYGSRGLRVMTEFIMRKFSDVIRIRAVEDELVSARGNAVYVQAVLVPELAVRLIMEDMNVLESEARGILSDSAEAGELLYEDNGDVVGT